MYCYIFFEGLSIFTCSISYPSNVSVKWLPCLPATAWASYSEITSVLTTLQGVSYPFPVVSDCLSSGSLAYSSCTCTVGRIPHLFAHCCPLVFIYHTAEHLPLFKNCCVYQELVAGLCSISTKWKRTDWNRDFLAFSNKKCLFSTVKTLQNVRCRVP